jgi:predicted phosphodiesterase
MRILLLSDIHSNLEALEASLAAAPPHDAVVNLGDIVGYGASPNEVTAMVRKLGSGVAGGTGKGKAGKGQAALEQTAIGQTVVRGNHDKVVTGLDDVESFNPIAGLAALWNRAQLTPENMDWLRALPQGPLTLPQLNGVQFVHGAPDDEDRYVVLIQDALPALLSSDVTVTFFGHTHIQGAFVLRNGFAETAHPGYSSIGLKETVDLEIETGVSYMINPGSVGQPRDGDWRAGFAVFDTDRRVITFCRVPYDVRTAQEKIFAASLPARLATRLAAGR